MVEAIIFDLDDTLIVEEDTARAAIAEALTFVGAPPDVDRALEAIREVWRASVHHPRCRELGIASWEGLWATFEHCHSSVSGLCDWVPEYRLLAWDAALRSLGADPHVAATAAERYVETQHTGHPLIQSAAVAVRSMAHVARCVLTNGPPDIQELKLRQTGLTDEFDAVAISGALGTGKPDPAAFAHVLGRIGVSPERAVMVGDSWPRDIEGAVAIGMQGLWISRGRPRPSALPHVRTLPQLDPSALVDL
ncbi:MAG TPA: HAD family hydrolase [Acidimicrobiales bacterium]|nr:HAD family hydrolase [Acidimicrobiales bacterium]